MKSILSILWRYKYLSLPQEYLKYVSCASKDIYLDFFLSDIFLFIKQTLDHNLTILLALLSRESKQKHST